MSNYERINWESGTKVKEGYTIINGQEYQTVQPEYTGNTPVNVDNLNHMDEQLEALSVDYIIEKDYSGIWSWNKYKSGRVDLFAWTQHTGLNVTSQSAGTYYGATKSLNLPFPIKRVAFWAVQETNSRSSGIYAYNVGFSGGGSGVSTTITTDFRAFSSMTNASCGVNYIIIAEVADEE